MASHDGNEAGGDNCPKRPRFEFFWRSQSPFSQWHPAKFTVDGITYNCAEQYMMHQKAVVFKDEKMADKIMKETSPRKQKAMGRKVQNFVPEEWTKVCREIVKQGNIAKFSQNEDLKKIIYATAGKELVEASPMDRVWGIGLAEHNPLAHNKETWRGTNWLGIALTEARNELMRKEGLDPSVLPEGEEDVNHADSSDAANSQTHGDEDSDEDSPRKVMKTGGKEEFTFFWKASDPFSQWHKSFFEVDGATYNCAEQYMMAQKAWTFGDAETAMKVMKEKDPKKQKQLGRGVKGYTEAKWFKRSQEVVKEGNIAKFSQNKHLRDKLFATAGTTLVEASPYDSKWGIGLQATDPAAQDRATWNGKNLLGKIITEVRDELMAQGKFS